MPELPEVQTVVDGLRPLLVGRSIIAVELCRPDIVRPPAIDLLAKLAGRAIVDLARRAKMIVFTLDTNERFYIHLGMTGQLTIEATEAPRRVHTHILLDMGGVQVRFVDPRRFGGLWFVGHDSGFEDRMGPEPLGLKWQDFAKRLKRTDRAIKVALLDQTLIAGIGNIYADEALFLARIHPHTRASKLTGEQIKHLNRAIQGTLRRAIKARGSTLRDYRDANGAAGKFQNQHRVYGRAGQPCSNCQGTIKRIVLGGRGTHFCPTCQGRSSRSG